MRVAVIGDEGIGTEGAGQARRVLGRLIGRRTLGQYAGLRRVGTDPVLHGSVPLTEYVLRGI